jgi:predicted O-linked N-acetylglucosamine transferase (SPINDLY family)
LDWGCAPSATPDDYVTHAATLARNVPELAENRDTLRERMRVSALTNGLELVLSMEDALRDAWLRWCRSR